jgi:type I restriction enzyme R subunit
VQNAVVRALTSHQKLATVLLKADKQAMTAFIDLIYELDRDRRMLDMGDEGA